MKKIILSSFIISLLFSVAWGNGLINVFHVDGHKSLYIKDQVIEINITNNYAITRVKQIFASNSHRVLEGEYIFPIEEGSEISNFSVWDDGKRLKGVIFEKRRAREIYESLVRRAIDPGLLEHRRTNEFSARLAPIPAYGTKRLEIEYTQLLKIDSNQINYRFGLVSKESSEKIENISISAKFYSEIPILKIEPYHKSIKVKKVDEFNYNITWSAANIDPDKDFGFYVTFQPKDMGFSLLTHKEKETEGYFFLSLIPQEEFVNSPKVKKKFLFLVDHSVSLYDNKDMVKDIISKTLNKIDSTDSFNFIFFNNYPELYSENFLDNTDENRSNVRGKINALKFYGGTNILKTFEEGFNYLNKDTSEGLPEIILISDGNVSYYDINYKNIISEIKKMNNNHFKIFCFGIGNYSNSIFLQDISDNSNGAYVHARRFENYNNLLTNFIDKFYLDYIKDLSVDYGNLNIYDTLPEEGKPLFIKQQLYFVGKYKSSGTDDIKITGNINEKEIKYKIKATLPALNELNNFIPRLWARERVNYLLKQIKLHGEKEEWIKEIIELSKKFNFVTPYTSFLAAPRSTLRPRVIRPADPYIFIKTDELVTRIIVKFPFGETKVAEFDRELNLWKVRFIVPKDTPDGKYFCTVITQDRFGNQFTEKLSYIIDSSPPYLKVWTTSEKVMKGDLIAFFAQASKDTEYLYVITPDKEKVLMRYETESGYSKGEWKVPALNSGYYELTVIAIDFAKNKSSQKIKIQVVE